MAAIIALMAGVGSYASRLAFHAGSRTVIAVSIFDNETGMAEQDRTVAGLSDLAVTRLAEMAPGGLAVIGNASVLRQPRNLRNLKAIASGVRADYVVLGQPQKSEIGLRFVTHLIRLSDRTHLKANRIAMPNGNVAGLESAVVADFDRAVRKHLLN